MIKETNEVKLETMYTFLVFIGFLLLTPFLCIFYLHVKICRYLCFYGLTRTYPHLDFVKHLSARSAMDTFRNQGMISVLLQIRGQCDVNLVKQRIMEDVIEKRNSDGTLRFPHMKKSLTQYWLQYAWIKDDSEFNIENHVIQVNNPTLGNRIVTSENIRDYINDAIMRHLPPWNNIPPWKVMLITTEPDKFYILARVHHLYISEDGITFGHLLMLDMDKEMVQPINNPNHLDSIENILQSVYHKPRYFPKLYNRICKFFSNQWSSLMKAYDPLENPNFLQSSPNIFQFYAVCLVAILATAVEYYQSDRPVEFYPMAREQMKRRQICAAFFLHCFINTLNPLVIINILMASCWWFWIKCVLHLPIIAAQYLLHDSLPIFKWFLLLVRCCGEILHLLHLIYTAPRTLLDEIILPMFHSPKHHLQKVSFCGRKVVHWTEPIPVQKIRRICDKTGVASCEIQLYCVSAALRHYFQKHDYARTNDILSTVRFVPQEQLLRSANSISSGLLCLSLPMDLPEDDALYGLYMMQLALQDALTTQTSLYLASLSQYDYGILTTVLPAFLSRIVLYVLSMRYSIMLTQVEPHSKEMKKMRLIWGQEVESLIYWRHPQANVSLSMTLMNYGDELRFATMSDAELAPESEDIVHQFISHLNKLSKEAEDYKPPHANVKHKHKQETRKL